MQPSEAAKKLADEVVAIRDGEVGDLVIEDLGGSCGAWISCEEPMEVEE